MARSFPLEEIVIQVRARHVDHVGAHDPGVGAHDVLQRRHRGVARRREVRSAERVDVVGVGVHVAPQQGVRVVQPVVDAEPELLARVEHVGRSDDAVAGRCWAAARTGSGSTVAIGLMRLVGITLPGNGSPVSGSLIAAPPEKSPARCACAQHHAVVGRPLPVVEPS